MHECHASKRFHIYLKYTKIATVDIFKFYNATCLLGDDLYNISSLILPEKKKEEATNPFYSDRLSLMCKLVWNNPFCILTGCRSKFQCK